MNSKQLVEWLEDRGELVISKADGGNYIVVTRLLSNKNSVLMTAEAPTLAEAIELLECER